MVFSMIIEEIDYNNQYEPEIEIEDKYEYIDKFQ